MYRHTVPTQQMIDDNPELHDLVNFYQKHTHSKTCRKYKNIKINKIEVDGNTTKTK